GGTRALERSCTCQGRSRWFEELRIYRPADDRNTSPNRLPRPAASAAPEDTSARSDRLRKSVVSPRRSEDRDRSPSLFGRRRKKHEGGHTQGNGQYRRAGRLRGTGAAAGVSPSLRP